jgi:DNA-binding LacI/PurR family transcriptional regulator
VGYDDIELARLPGIDLTTVSQKRVPLGPVVLDRLIAKIDSIRESVSEKILFDPVLVIRKSCGFEARGGVYEPEEAGAVA